MHTKKADSEYYMTAVLSTFIVLRAIKFIVLGYKSFELNDDGLDFQAVFTII